MLNEPHYPSKWSVAVVFLVIFLLIGGIFAWAFYFNFGKLLVSADQNFQLEINHETFSCLKTCEIDLPPQIYDAVAKAPGYYDEGFVVEIQRWGQVEKALSLQLVPYLKAAVESDLPVEDPSVTLKNQGGKSALFVATSDGEKFVTDFASLKNPLLRMAENSLLVVDDGRVFFVDISSGRKIQRFDESVQVRDALVSDDGKRILFFLETQGSELIWVWNQETLQVSPLTWYAKPELVQWDLGSNYRILLVTDQLRDPNASTLLDEVVESANPDVIPLGLFRYNIDRDLPQLITEFSDKKPQHLLRRSDRFFLQYEDESFDEVVVK